MNSIIAAVKNTCELEKSLETKISTVFFLYPDISELVWVTKKTHEAGKEIYIHIDLTSGLGKDKSGIEFAKAAGVDGIISTRASLIKLAKECGLKTVQRFFIVDTHSIDTTAETLKNSKTDYIEVMPGIAPKIIEKLKERVVMPIIAGGLIEETDEVELALGSGAYAVSTGAYKLWGEEI